MSFVCVLGFSMVAVFIYMQGIFLWARQRQRIDVIDAAWGPGFSVLVASATLISNNFNPLTLILTAVWGFRLAFHIGQRQRKHSEDLRYVAMRSRWTWRPWLQSYIKVFLLQATLIGVVGCPLVWSAAYGRPLESPLEILGSFVWLIGFLWESMADWQLTQFKNDPKNKGLLMTKGLWSLSRHPNYFGEVVLWWGFYLMAAGSGGWWTAIGPLTITFLILRVSGVPMLEEQMKLRPDFAKYAKETPAFFPAFRRRRL